MISTKSIEELFLKIFKGTILIIMGLTLIAIVFALITGTYQFAQTPKAPDIAKKAPEKEIDFSNLNQFLQDQEKKRLEQERQRNSRQPEPQSTITRPNNIPTVRFLEDATRLYRCAEEFGKNTGQVLSENDDQKITQNIDLIRRRVEEDAVRSKLRGDRWVTSAVTFTCKALSESSLVALKKEGKVGSVLFSIMDYHRTSWDEIQTEKQDFENSERTRVAQEIRGEETRVAVSKANALRNLIAAAGAFGLFMLLALYLLAAKIETNMRMINESIRQNHVGNIGNKS